VAILLQNEHVCIQEDRIRSLEEDRTETKVYVKIIREDLGEIKAAIKSRASPDGGGGTEPFWQKVIMKLLELITTAFIILAGIWGLAKFIKP
jgi:hypothetical protein